MAPEVWDGDNVDPRADVYAFGLVLLEMLRGAPAVAVPSDLQHAHPALQLQALREQHRGGAAAVACGDIEPRWLRRLARSCVASRHHSRPATFAEVLDQLDRHVTGWSRSPADQAKPSVAPDLLNKGASLRSLGYVEEAIECYDLILSARPDTAALVNRGLAHAELGRFDDALRDLDAAVTAAATPSDAARALSNRALVHTRLGDNDIALADARAAIEHDPNYATGFHNLGCILLRLNAFAEAVDATRTAVELGLDLGETYLQLGQALFMAGQVAESVAALDTAVERHADAGDPYLLRGRAFLELGERERAVRDLGTALSAGSAPRVTVLARYYRGAARAALGRVDDAASDYRLFLEVAPPELVTEIIAARRYLTNPAGGTTPGAVDRRLRR